MWATLALLTALQLTPAQAGQLRLTNDRATYGKHGATRADNNNIVIPIHVKPPKSPLTAITIPQPPGRVNHSASSWSSVRGGRPVSCCTVSVTCAA